MQIDTSTLMMLFFILFLLISLWKISAFLPNKQLEDDDTTEESQNELLSVMIAGIKSMNENVSVDELYVNMMQNKDFDKEKFWRFNKNKLNKLLESYYMKNPNTSSIRDIYNTVS